MANKKVPAQGGSARGHSNMEHRREDYRIVTEWSTEDGAFVSRVPAFGPGCAAHGDSAEEAEREARIAVAGILEVMAEHGDPAPATDRE